MNYLALTLGAGLVIFAVYTVSDPLSRARPWVSMGASRRDSAEAEEKQRIRTVIYATGVALTGLLFIAVGLGV